MRVIWAASAKRRQREIVTRIAEHDQDAAFSILNAFENGGRTLGKFPALGRKGRVPGTRELSVHKHYFLVYELTDTHVHILSIWHTAQQYPPES